MKYLRDHKSIFVIAFIVTALICLLLAGFRYVLGAYKVTTVSVEGNVHYSNGEIMKLVMDGPFGDNSLFLSLKYREKSVENVPFVSKMDIKVEDPHTIRITVYEKALAGYVEYLDKFMYFDKEGMVVEASDQKTAGIPLVTGLSFDHVILYEPLPVEDPEIFRSILSITQLVNKYNLGIDRMFFAPDNTIMLYFDDVRVALGDPEELEEKIMKLQYMLPDLTGRSGVLRMENYTEETKNVSFEPDPEPEPEPKSEAEDEAVAETSDEEQPDV
ncbi:MAG: FtsQ-type POTRA domain-containing protein [Lachnospiraceae bacterium]|nr:FtsQ-type POTRA domain-containing protein [Lachnospiraceae bacterium]